MKFKIDENLPAEFATILGEAGFEAATVGEEHLSGTTDSALLERCRTEARVLVTLDLDFANVRIIPVLKRRPVEGQLWIVQPDRIRYREA